MKRNLISIFILLFSGLSILQAQPLKPRPDILPWQPDPNAAKAALMATTVEEMASWDRYPTYDTYTAMMQQWEREFPTLCHIDTIGYSGKGRLILSLYIGPETDDDLGRPEFFYSSSMHGDELTGFVMMLRLIDTLLHGYGTNEQYTTLIDHTRISINPLSNPDGAYWSGDNSVADARRYNSLNVDLNRNYPDPFGTDPLDSLQTENSAMIAYLSKHNFLLSANLHGGAEVLNYPWDSFTSAQQPHPDRAWWIEVSRRFVDTSRTYSSYHFNEVTSHGYIAGGDWYVIPNGRQDYVNYYHNCRELTMEISSEKTPRGDQLPEYWRILQHSLVNYIEEIHSLPGSVAINDPAETKFTAYPSPTHDKVFLSTETSDDIVVYNTLGRRVKELPAGSRLVDLSMMPSGLYMIRSGNYSAKVVKR